VTSGDTFQRVSSSLNNPTVLDEAAQIIVNQTKVPAFTFYKAYNVGANNVVGCTPTRDFWDASLVEEVLEVGTRHLEEAGGPTFVTCKLPLELDNDFGFDTLVLVGPSMHSEFSDDEALHRATVLIYPVHYCEVTGGESESEWEFLLRESLDPADWQRRAAKEHQGRDRVPYHRVRFDVPFFGEDSEYQLARWPWTSELIRTVFSRQDGWIVIENVDGHKIDVWPRDGSVEISRPGSENRLISVKREAVEFVWRCITPTRARAAGHATQDSGHARQVVGWERLEERVADGLRVVASHGGFVILRGASYYVQFLQQKARGKCALFEVVSNGSRMSRSLSSETDKRGMTKHRQEEDLKVIHNR
jgi:hypothetical protein